MKLHLTTFLFFLLAALSAQTDRQEIRQSLFFASDSDQLDQTATDQLTSFTDNLLAYANYELRLEAFTDEQGSPTYNDALARSRAASVEDVLASLLVKASTTEVLTYGESQARQATTSDDERRGDRRVDLVATVTYWEDAGQAIGQARQQQDQRFTLEDPTQRQSFRGSKGGIFVLEANSLIRADGQVATGPVTIDLVEAYDMTEMVIAGLVTTSGDKRLVTGGMLRLTALDADGQTLQLKEGTSLAAATPTDDFNEQMRIFSGREHNDDGTPGSWEQLPQGVANSPAALFPDYQGRWERNEVEAMIAQLVYKVMREWHADNPEPEEPSYLQPSPYSRKAPEKIDTNTIFFQAQGMDKIFMSKTERQERTSKKRRLAVKIYDAQLKRHLNAKQYATEMPGINAERKATYEAAHQDWATRLGIKKREARAKFTEKFRAQFEKRRAEIQANRKARRSAFQKALLEFTEKNGPDQRTISRYFFAVTELGWSNIDVFHSSEEPLAVLASLPGSSKQTSVMLVPDDRPSLLAYLPRESPGSWRRSGIPQGVGYKIIAYQVKDGQLQFAHGRVSAADGQEQELSFAPLPLRELKGKIAEVLGS